MAAATLKKLPTAERAVYADEIAAAEREADQEEAAVKEALYTDLRSLRKQCSQAMMRRGSRGQAGHRGSVKIKTTPASPPPERAAAPAGL